MRWGRLLFYFFIVRILGGLLLATRHFHNTLLRAVAVKLIAILLLAPLVAAATDIREEQLKAAYLFNFAKYTQWDENAVGKDDKAVMICVLNSEEIAQQLQRVQHRTIAGKAISIREVSEPQSIAGCTLVYIGARALSAELAVSKWLEQGVLVITEWDDGGVIEFVRIEDRLRFIVDLTLARKAGLKLSSDLLNLAVSVTGESKE